MLKLKVNLSKTYLVAYHKTHIEEPNTMVPFIFQNFQKKLKTNFKKFWCFKIQTWFFIYQKVHVALYLNLYFHEV